MKYLVLVFILSSSLILQGQDSEAIKLSEDLHILKLSENVYIHRSYATVAPYGRFYSNGMIYVVEDACYVFDTPMTEEITQELLDWIIKDQKLTIVGVVVNHFHEDCLGGLRLFHQVGIPSYSGKMTQVLAEADTVVVPQIGFVRRKKLRLSGKKIILYYPGEGHSRDNTVAYIPDEKVLFGGCMVKSLRSGKGNLADANVTAWPITIKKVSAKFGDAKWVIPGHGKAGGTELLDFTIKLFSQKP